MTGGEYFLLTVVTIAFLLIGIGIVIEIDNLVQTLRLVDVSC